MINDWIGVALLILYLSLAMLGLFYGIRFIWWLKKKFGRKNVN